MLHEIIWQFIYDMNLFQIHVAIYHKIVRDDEIFDSLRMSWYYSIYILSYFLLDVVIFYKIISQVIWNNTRKNDFKNKSIIKFR